MMKPSGSRITGLAILCVGLILMAAPIFAQPAGEAEGGGRLLREQSKPDSPIPATATERPAGEAEGGGRLIREQAASAGPICAGCLAPTSIEGSKGSITPYGRVELDAIYSNRNTNPLDPGQFNGYATAAGKSSNASTTLNPRFSVIGLRADRTDGRHSLKGVVEIDFYGQTDNAGNLPPRLRLANIAYTFERTSLTVGQDWTPIMALHPNLIDFSIMGYNGNLWQRIPQITLRHSFTDSLEGLLTVLRFERGLSAIQPQTQRRPFTGSAVGGVPPVSCTTPTGPFACSENAFNDPVQNPYYGTRLAYTGKGNLQGVTAAISAAYRYYRSAPTAPTGGIPSGQDINSYLVGGELVVPITTKLKFAGEIAYGQALGVEFFRFGQERNIVTGEPIRTVVGWAELDYVYSRDYTFVAGYGFDNPFNSDLQGVNAVDTQYRLNHRTYLTVVRRIWADFYTGFEWNHLMTEWSTGEKFHGDNYMLSFWYNF